MKINKEQLKQYNLDFLSVGRQLHVPICFQKEITLLFDNNQRIIAIITARRLQDYTIYTKIMCLLNQLVRYYHRPATIYCLSYRAIATYERKYIVFSQQPKENMD